MPQSNPQTAAADVPELVLTRFFEAPPERVFQAWTDPQHLARWFGPEVFSIPVCEVDVRPGGALHIVMRAPDGADYPMRGQYREVVPPQRLVFTSTADDAQGHTLFETLHTVTFAAEGTGTRLTLRAQVLWASEEAAPYLAGMEAGWTQSLVKLAAYLAAA